MQGCSVKSQALGDSGDAKELFGEAGKWSQVRTRSFSFWTKWPDRGVRGDRTIRSLRDFVRSLQRAARKLSSLEDQETVWSGLVTGQSGQWCETWAARKQCSKMFLDSREKWIRWSGQYRSSVGQSRWCWGLHWPGSPIKQWPDSPVSRPRKLISWSNS